MQARAWELATCVRTGSLTCVVTRKPVTQPRGSLPCAPEHPQRPWSAVAASNLSRHFRQRGGKEEANLPPTQGGTRWPGGLGEAPPQHRTASILRKRGPRAQARHAQAAGGKQAEHTGKSGKHKTSLHHSPPDLGSSCDPAVLPWDGRATPTPKGRARTESCLGSLCYKGIHISATP